LTEHLHDFARETALTTDEWMTALQFLTSTGQICTSTRQEFILLSDVLGLSVLVDALNHPKPPGATENTVLGPFFTEDAADIPLGDSIVQNAHDEKWCLVRGKVTDEKGSPIEGAIIEVWETDETGHYDTQYADRDHPDYRGRLRSDEKGDFYFKAIRPVPYPIPHDGYFPPM
jgi:protocatechuate 3,4-dioxygenase beta subunit